jgi:hypothetical protein
MHYTKVTSNFNIETCSLFNKAGSADVTLIIRDFNLFKFLNSYETDNDE